ncbi:MAG: HNH endonuclease signature motif containing protein [Gaiellaceae bacterium]
MEVHHRVPVVDGGSNALSELEVLCARCHRLDPL